MTATKAVARARDIGRGPAKKEDLETAKDRFVGFAAVQISPSNA